MPLATIGEMYLGAIDGKHEYVDGSVARKPHFDSFVMPSNIDQRDLLTGGVYLVQGFRGTGKTSLLRWVAMKLRDQGALGSVILFKSDISESKRIEISKSVGAELVEVNSEKMGISQDFKEAWRWFLHRKICEILIEGKGVEDTPEFQRYTKLVGLGDQTWFEKAIAGLPRFEKARIRVKSLFDFVSAEVDADIKGGATPSVLVSTVIEKLDTYLARIKLRKSVFLCLDELEVFYHTHDQHKRDICMVRDLLFAAASLTEFCRQKSQDVKFFAGIRTEVMDAMGSDGQELSRLVEDCGVKIAWHHEKRSVKHQLFNIVRRKIWSSEAKVGLDLTQDPVAYYFPAKVGGVDLDAYLLDQSFYKPRDLILRLRLAQDADKSQATFSSANFERTEKQYSAKMWEEVTYELSATYTQDEVRAIEGLFIGQRATFDRNELAQRLRIAASTNRIADGIQWKRGGVDRLLNSLYRIGAIGNVFAEDSVTKQRWVFRGDPHLDSNHRMGLHGAFSAHLSVARSRKIRSL